MAEMVFPDKSLSRFPALTMEEDPQNGQGLTVTEFFIG